MNLASEIRAMERAALDRSDRGDPGGFLEISDPEVVYIDPFLERPIHGLAALTEYYRGFQSAGGLENAAGEMLNSQVAMAGDVAVLTFNYRSKGGPAHGWNATEVFRRTESGWRIIHTHWSFVKPAQP